MSTFGRENDAIWRQKRNITAEIYDIQSGLSRQRARANASSIKIIPFDEIRLNESYRPYLVRGLIPKEGLTVVWGPPKSGKSFAVFDLCMHVALGWEYRGRRVQQGSVVYCSFEGQGGLGCQNRGIQATTPRRGHRGHTVPRPDYDARSREAGG